MKILPEDVTSSCVSPLGCLVVLVFVKANNDQIRQLLGTKSRWLWQNATFHFSNILMNTSSFHFQGPQKLSAKPALIRLLLVQPIIPLRAGTAALEVYQLRDLKVKFCRPLNWKHFPIMSWKLQRETSALTVYLVKEGLVLFLKDGLMNIHFLLQNLGLEWLLLLKSLSLRVSKAIKSGWYVSLSTIAR